MTTARYIKGSGLAPDIQAEAKRRFVHRYTREHVPGWVKGTNYKPQFAVRADGGLDERYTSCRSRPTWPEGKGVWGRRGVDW